MIIRSTGYAPNIISAWNDSRSGFTQIQWDLRSLTIFRFPAHTVQYWYDIYPPFYFSRNHQTSCLEGPITTTITVRIIKHLTLADFFKYIRIVVMHEIAFLMHRILRVSNLVGVLFLIFIVYVRVSSFPHFWSTYICPAFVVDRWKMLFAYWFYCVPVSLAKHLL